MLRGLHEEEGRLWGQLCEEPVQRPWGRDCLGGRGGQGLETPDNGGRGGRGSQTCQRDMLDALSSAIRKVILFYLQGADIGML